MPRGIKQFLIDRVIHCWNSIVNVGVHPAMPFIESRRTKLLNLLALPSIPFMLVFSIVNTVQGRYVLSLFNFLDALISIMILVFHKYGKYLTARLVLIYCSIVVYTITGLCFRNGAEYFLLNILVITVLIYDNRRIVIGVSIIIIAAFVAIVLLPQPAYLGPVVPQQRVWANVGVSLFFLVLALSFFKYIQSDYQREVEQHREDLLAMNKDKEKLFSIVAHDIRSPLATLESLLDMFRRGLYDRENMGEAAEMLHERVSQLGGTLDNVLRWSARSMRGIQTKPRHFLLAPVLTEVLQFFKLIIAQKEITVDVQLSVAAALYADRDQVSVILRNLVSNALKFSRTGGRVELTAVNDGNQVVIRITDCGVGMDNQRLKSLFTTQQLPAFGTGGERGTGLGLLLCRDFIKQNNGAIEVESSPDMGTCFTIYLPKGDAPAGDAIIPN
ncbi:HAMP domain-containing sensor histidine kinase [Chitinophaga sp. 212800010-3]|uniref:sensor histidine kinase n=1 Tax=unclassified Chitinophaga TaxID=2619133 RepID=UPI002DF16D6F|nr:Signal transduction histidine kinase [Chitinophaga sp. 212800010-3]